MTQVHSVIHLIHSMTAVEKKAFSSHARFDNRCPNYLTLYTIIARNGTISDAELKEAFLKACPGASLETSAKYLFYRMLDTIQALRKTQDSFFSLFDTIMKARILFEMSLFDECFDLLREVMEQARKNENYYALLLASRLELEYLLAVNFPGMSEKSLLQKQFQLTEALKFLRRINEQSSLYEILKYRVLYKGHTRSQQQKNELNDLVFSELSLVASQNMENFEINKLHQLFQSVYLISVGDYKSAQHSFYELNTLFESNRHLWSDPPIYYLNMLEGVLESLRSIHDYEGMGYFLDQLKKIESSSTDFRINLVSITFQYELFPLLDTGDFVACRTLIDQYKFKLYEKSGNLNRVRQAELYLYTSIVYLGSGEYHKALKALNQIYLRIKNITFLPLHRTIRLINLVILYHLDETELIKNEIRSLKRDMSSNDKGYRIERFLFGFLNKHQSHLTAGRPREWEKVGIAIDDIRQDPFEQQILRIFDFTAWIESQYRLIPLSDVLKQKTAKSSARP